MSKRTKGAVLVAALAYEAKAVDYDYACKVIFGD